MPRVMNVVVAVVASVASVLLSDSASLIVKGAGAGASEPRRPPTLGTLLVLRALSQGVTTRVVAFVVVGAVDRLEVLNRVVE